VVGIGDPAHTAERALVAGADPDRDVCALREQRLEDEIVELEEAAGKGSSGP
jgi:hypothetical protein